MTQKRNRINLRYEGDKDWIDAMADKPIEKNNSLAAGNKSMKEILQSLRKKEFWQNVGIIVAMLIWVGGVVLGVQYGMREVFRLLFATEDLETSAMQAFFTFVVDALILILVILIPEKIFKKARTNKKELGVEGNLSWTDIGLAPVGFMAYMVFALAGQWLMPFIKWDQEQEIGYNLSALFGTELLYAVIAIVIIAPIAEELIFRGWLYGKMKTRTPVWLAVILVSILFGLMHAPLNVSINIFFLSVVLCMMREMTGTIYAGVLLHMLKNGIALAFLLWSQNPYLFS